MIRRSPTWAGPNSAKAATAGIEREAAFDENRDEVDDEAAQQRAVQHDDRDEAPERRLAQDAPRAAGIGRGRPGCRGAKRLAGADGEVDERAGGVERREPQRPPRQPKASISPCVSGRNTVLASPPTSDITVMPRRASGPSIRVSTAKPGSYHSVALIAKPIPTQTARNAG